MIPCIGSLHVSAEHPVDRSALPKAQKLITMQSHSARTRTAEVFGSSHHLAHFGRAQAVLRSGTAAGKVTVTVSCEGCEDETIDIVVEYKRNTPPIYFSPDPKQNGSGLVVYDRQLILFEQNYADRG